MKLSIASSIIYSLAKRNVHNAGNAKHRVETIASNSECLIAAKQDMRAVFNALHDIMLQGLFVCLFVNGMNVFSIALPPAINYLE